MRDSMAQYRQMCNQKPCNPLHSIGSLCEIHYSKWLHSVMTNACYSLFDVCDSCDCLYSFLGISVKWTALLEHGLDADLTFIPFIVDLMTLCILLLFSDDYSWQYFHWWLIHLFSIIHSSDDGRHYSLLWWTQPVIGYRLLFRPLEFTLHL